MFVAPPATGQFLDLIINEDTTATNYNYRRSLLNASGEAYAGANDNTLGYSTAGLTGAYIKGEFMGNSDAGVIMGMTQVNTFGANVQLYQHAWHYSPSGVITALGIAGQSGSPIGDGSILRVYKRNIY